MVGIVMVWVFGNGKQHPLTTLTEVFPCFSSVVRQMPGLNSQSRGTERISSELLSFVLCLSLCYAIVFMLFYCYYVVLLLCCSVIIVLSYVLIVCTVPLPPGVNPIAVDKYISYILLSVYLIKFIVFRNAMPAVLYMVTKIYEKSVAYTLRVAPLFQFGLLSSRIMS